jgi:hypothetical protein
MYIHNPANLIRLAYSRYKHFCINTVYKKGEAPKILAALHLFVETMPICKAVATGNGNNEF